FMRSLALVLAKLQARMASLAISSRFAGALLSSISLKQFRIFSQSRSFWVMSDECQILHISTSIYWHLTHLLCS
ncbi:hypothetical protein MKW92_005387, partial [Papaver armeniacum]